MCEIYRNFTFPFSFIAGRVGFMNCMDINYMMKYDTHK